jgi:hypothetical protein
MNIFFNILNKFINLNEYFFNILSKFKIEKKNS